MPFRTRETLEAWLHDFRSLGYPTWDTLRVIVQDGENGADTGLIALDLENASTTAYVEPIMQGEPRWVVTLEARHESIEIDAVRLTQLSAELVVLAALVAVLQSKADAFLASR